MRGGGASVGLFGEIRINFNVIIGVIIGLRRVLVGFSFRCPRRLDIIIDKDGRGFSPRVHPATERITSWPERAWLLRRLLSAALRTYGGRPVQIVETLEAPRAGALGA